MEFLDLVAPRDPAFRARALEVWREREDLQRAFPDPAVPGFTRWALVFGVLEYPDRLGPFVPPLPPAELRQTACAGADPVAHLETGLDDARAIADLAATYLAAPPGAAVSVLDFGCACGRLARWLPAVFPGGSIAGADVRAAAVEWCAANLPGTFRTNAIEPPLPFPDHSFDLVVSLSVFTHLTRESNERWIRELARVTRPGGRMFVSMLGAFALFVIQRLPENQRFFEMTAEQARAYLRRLPREHWILHPIATEAVVAMDGVESGYGQVFNDEAFVRSAWAPWVDIVGVVPAGQGLFQDYYVLEPRVGAPV